MNEDETYPCPRCGEQIPPGEDWLRFHTFRNRLSRWLWAHILKHFR
jgi:hypothetical protein